jgi:hypothetical protein
MSISWEWTVGLGDVGFGDFTGLAVEAGVVGAQPLRDPALDNGVPILLRPFPGGSSLRIETGLRPRLAGHSVTW